MTHLIVWRHGRTAWNAEHRFQGQTDVDLDETGFEQAAAAAPRLAALKPDMIISSDLKRATSTATVLAELTRLPIKLDPRLRERHFGPWQGLTAREIEERYPDDFLRWAGRPEHRLCRGVPDPCGEPSRGHPLNCPGPPPCPRACSALGRLSWRAPLGLTDPGPHCRDLPAARRERRRSAEKSWARDEARATPSPPGR